MGNIITFACSDGYSLIGGAFVTCTSMQRWYPEALPVCGTVSFSTGVRGGPSVGIVIVMLVGLYLVDER